MHVLLCVCYTDVIVTEGRGFFLNKKSRIYGTSDSFAKINLICQRVRSVRESEVRGRTRPHRFESPIGLSRTAAAAVILGPV